MSNKKCTKTNFWEETKPNKLSPQTTTVASEIDRIQ